jgi:hypothetical protein
MKADSNRMDRDCQDKEEETLSLLYPVYPVHPVNFFFALSDKLAATG